MNVPDEHIDVAMVGTEDASAADGGRVAGAELRAAQRAREAAHVEDEVAGTHHQFGGAQSGAAAITATGGEQSAPV